MSSSIVEESVIILMWARLQSMSKDGMSKDNEYVAYARNTESGCKLFFFAPEISRSVWEKLRAVCTHDLGQDSPMQTSCPVNKS